MEWFPSTIFDQNSVQYKHLQFYTKSYLIPGLLGSWYLQLAVVCGTVWSAMQCSAVQCIVVCGTVKPAMHYGLRYSEVFRQQGTRPSQLKTTHKDSAPRP